MNKILTSILALLIKDGVVVDLDNFLVSIPYKIEGEEYSNIIQISADKLTVTLVKEKKENEGKINVLKSAT